MNHSVIKCNLIAAGIFLVPTAMLIALLLSEGNQVQNCHDRIVMGEIGTPGLAPHAWEIECMAP